jgi:hypothetical protein
MTPAERTQAWRKLNPLDSTPEAQRLVIEAWIAKPEACPYFLHRLSYEIRSKRTGRRQTQLIHNAVRLSRASVTWYLLRGEYQPPNMLDFSPRLHSIQQRSDLE